jgi:hypothetical protein
MRKVEYRPNGLALARARYFCRASHHCYISSLHLLLYRIVSAGKVRIVQLCRGDSCSARHPCQDATNPCVHRLPFLHRFNRHTSFHLHPQFDRFPHSDDRQPAYKALHRSNESHASLRFPSSDTAVLAQNGFLSWLAAQVSLCHRARSLW